MPHLTLEHSADVETCHDISALCTALFEALAAHPAVPDPRSLKIRALPCPHWHIGTEPQSFAHATLLLLPGRDTATRSDMSACPMVRKPRNLGGT